MAAVPGLTTNGKTISLLFSEGERDTKSLLKEFNNELLQLKGEATNAAHFAVSYNNRPYHIGGHGCTVEDMKNTCQRNNIPLPAAVILVDGQSIAAALVSQTWHVCGRQELSVLHSSGEKCKLSAAE